MFYITTCLTAFDGVYGSIGLLTAGQFHLLGIKFKNIIYTNLIKCGVKKDDVLKFSKDFNTSYSIATRK